MSQLQVGHNCEPNYKDRKMPILNVWATEDPIGPGDTILTSNGRYTLSIYQVMYKF